MVSNMPRQIGKGPIIDRMEHRYADYSNRVQALKRLRKINAAGDKANEVLAKKAKKAGLFVDSDNSAKLMDELWLGPEGRFWITNEAIPEGYVGGILGRGLAEALEVSLAIDSDEDLDALGESIRNGTANTDDFLPIEAMWVCGLEDFEVSVTWNMRQVTVIFATPPIRSRDSNPVIHKIKPTGQERTAKTSRASFPRGFMVVQAPSPAEFENPPAGDLYTVACLTPDDGGYGKRP